MGLVSCLVSVGYQMVSVWSVWSTGSRVEWSLYLVNYFCTVWSFTGSGSLCFNPTTIGWHSGAFVLAFGQPWMTNAAFVCSQGCGLWDQIKTSILSLPSVLFASRCNGNQMVLPQEGRQCKVTMDNSHSFPTGSMMTNHQQVGKSCHLNASHATDLHCVMPCAQKLHCCLHTLKLQMWIHAWWSKMRDSWTCLHWCNSQNFEDHKTTQF